MKNLPLKATMILRPTSQQFNTQGGKGLGCPIGEHIVVRLVWRTRPWPAHPCDPVSSPWVHMAMGTEALPVSQTPGHSKLGQLEGQDWWLSKPNTTSVTPVLGNAHCTSIHINHKNKSRLSNILEDLIRW